MSDNIKISVEKHTSLADALMGMATFTEPDKFDSTYRVTASDGEHCATSESSDKEAAIEAATSRLNSLRDDD